ncbi:DNA glycosylase AlkZ-like family protein [Bacteroidota bacterium]
MSSFLEKIRSWTYNRQLLGKQGNNLEEILDQIIGVYSSHPTAPLSLYARIKKFNAEEFYKLERNRLAFRIPAMRLSVYLLSRNNASQIYSAIIPPRDNPVWEKRYSQKGRIIPVQHYKIWKEKILECTANPLTSKEIRKITGIPGDKIKLVLNRMAFEGFLLRVGDTNMRSNLVSYVSARKWANDIFERIDENKSLTWLAEEYIRAFGPVRVKDFQWWAGITGEKANRTFSEIDVIELERHYFILKKDLSTFNTFNSVITGIDLLPQWDCYTMAYAPDGRARLVNELMQEKLYGKLGATGGNALGAILINGLVQGIWTSKFNGKQMVVNISSFKKPGEKIEDKIKLKLEEIGNLLNAGDVIVEMQ